MVFVATQKHTFGSAAEQYVDTAENMFRLSHGGAALAHDATIATNAPYTILPALSVLPVTLALIYELAKVGTAIVMLDLMRWQARNDIIAMDEQLPN